VGHGYSLREVGSLLGLSRSIISGLIDAGFVSPARGTRNELRFTFKDLVVLRAARALTVSGISATRILRSLRRLRAQLPEQMPLTGLRIEAVGDTMVVGEGDRRWQPEDGQYVFGFAITQTAGRVAFLDAPAAPAAVTDWCALGVSLEDSDPVRAEAAYRSAISSEPANARAYSNLGRLLHGRGAAADAETTYREGIARCEPDPIALFNLGVLLHDAHRLVDAAEQYRAALSVDPHMADAHYNLALVCEATGSRQEAIKHLNAYRKHQG
jgi:hypothetical protein